MTTRIAIAITAAYVALILIASFNMSLPLWCANPAGTGNWAVQSLCK